MMILVIGWHTPSDVIRRPAGVCCGSCLFVVVLFVSSLVFVSTFPLARIFAPSNLNPPPPPPPSPPSPNFNPNPAYATQSFLSSLRIFPLCLSLQCAGFVSAPALHTVRVFLFAPLRPALHVLGWLAGLLLSKLSSAAVASP